MTYGRREIAPSEQIKALRHARDRYAELADRIHNDTESTLDAAEKRLREEDARRIAKAYDRSLSNNVARLSGMEGTHKSITQTLGPWWIGALLMVALACLLPFAYTPARDGFLKLRDAGTVASNRPPAESAPPADIPPAVIEQNPLPETAPKTLKADARKPAIALAAPRKIVPPRGPITKEAAPREATIAKPAPQPVQKPPEPANAAAPAQPLALAPAQPAPAQPAPAQPAPAAPLPAPVETPAPQVAAAIPPPAAIPSPVAIPPAPLAIRPEPIAATHTLPRYPSLSAQIGEAGTTKMSVAISPQGQASDCRITQSSGSIRLDSAACAHVTDHWRWRPFSRDSTAPAPRASVTMVWNLSKPGR